MGAVGGGRPPGPAAAPQSQPGRLPEGTWAPGIRVPQINKSLVGGMRPRLGGAPSPHVAQGLTKLADFWAGATKFVSLRTASFVL